ncbi:TonB-dependent receptor plug domain-containing protein, partial [Pacificimonas sp. WHA3]|nr:TonB-dependent receptor plug domain-containing protein [Pacificimonas pallii]
MTKSIFRTALCTSSAIVAAATLSTSVVAQETPGADAAEEEQQQVIVVTGSRIASTDVVTTAPLQVVSEQAIESSGVVNIQSLLLENPVFGAPTLSRNNTSFSTSASGIATVDLRNLGTARTLVLQNGRRIVAGVDGSSAVDLNMIPTPLIERVEVLTSGGASAIYGSDAVAGVVNFILKDDFEGAEFDGQIGLSEEGDAVTYLGNVTLGANFDDGRGNAVVFAGYSKEGAAFKRDHQTEAGSAATDSISQIFFGGEFDEKREPFF